MTLFSCDSWNLIIYPCLLAVLFVKFKLQESCKNKVVILKERNYLKEGQSKGQGLNESKRLSSQLLAVIQAGKDQKIQCN